MDSIEDLKLGLDRMMRDNSELIVKIHSLEAELSGYNSATPSYVKGLEAEVERLRIELKKYCERFESGQHIDVGFFYNKFSAAIAKAALRRDG